MPLTIPSIARNAGPSFPVLSCEATPEEATFLNLPSFSDSLALGDWELKQHNQLHRHYYIAQQNTRQKLNEVAN